MRHGVLIVAPYLPWPADFGGALRVYHLARGLARDHDVTLLAPVREVELPDALALGEELDVTVVPARWTPRQPPDRRKRLAQLRSLVVRRSYLEQSLDVRRLQPAVDRLFLTRRVDLVQYELPQTAVVRPTRPRPTLVDAFDIQHELTARVARTASSESQRLFNLLEARKVRWFERGVWREATVCVAASDRDAARITATAGTPAFEVPNGVDSAFFGEVRRGRRPRHVVFTGAMRHQPNAEGARWYVEQVLPLLRRALPDATLAIVGADPPPAVTALVSEGVRVTGRVDDVRPYLAEAAVAVVPLLAGGGTRLKILEAFAAGVPVVATTLGAEGLAIRDGEQLLLADTPAAFAESVRRVMTDPELATRLADAGRRLAREEYDWSAIVPRLVAAHDAAVERFERLRGTT